MALALVLNRSRRVAAEDSPAFGAIAERFRRAGDLERAVALCQEGLRKFPSHLSSRVTLGWALLDLGRYDEARAELEQVLRRAPDNLAAIRGLAQLHDRTEHDDVASMHAGPSRWPLVDLSEAAEPVSELTEDVPDAAHGPWSLPSQPAAFEAPPSLAVASARPTIIDEAIEPEDSFGAADSVAVLSVDAGLADDLLNLPDLHVEPAAFAPPPPLAPPAPPAAPLAAAPPPTAKFLRIGHYAEPRETVQVAPTAPPPVVMPVWDEGPGPWPPVIDDDEATAPDPALHAMAADEGLDEWPPVDRTAEVPAVPASEAATDPAPASPKTGLLNALSRFRRRVDSRREAIVSEYVAG
jgi:hypothetical protein